MPPNRVNPRRSPSSVGKSHHVTALSRRPRVPPSWARRSVDRPRSTGDRGRGARPLEHRPSCLCKHGHPVHGDESPCASDERYHLCSIKMTASPQRAPGRRPVSLCSSSGPGVASAPARAASPAVRAPAWRIAHAASGPARCRSTSPCAWRRTSTTCAAASMHAAQGLAERAGGPAGSFAAVLRIAPASATSRR